MTEKSRYVAGGKCKPLSLAAAKILAVTAHAWELGHIVSLQPSSCQEPASSHS